MKRDWEMIRWLLNEAEDCGSGFPLVLTVGTYSGRHYRLEIGERDFEEVYEHVLLLGDHELAKVRDLGRTVEGPSGATIDRLTMEGHDFLEASRDEARWKTALTMVNEKGGAVTVGILIQILSTLLKQQFGLQ